MANTFLTFILPLYHTTSILSILLSKIRKITIKLTQNSKNLGVNWKFLCYNKAMKKKSRVVIALGGNALQKQGEVTAEAQQKVAEKVGRLIAKLSADYEIIVAHGNGPQVGNILIHEESASTKQAPAMPLVTAVAMSQGQIGYWLTQAIDNALIAQGKRKPVASIITQVIVDRKDPAFKHPSKPIGQFYDSKEAIKLIKARGWTMKEDSGRGFRRVVPSPQPLDIVEKHEIMTLVETGTIVIAVGGGGIPVIQTKLLKQLKGIDAVIDKDFAAEKLAELVKADIFVSVTAVPYAYLNYNTPSQLKLGRLTTKQAREHIAMQHFGKGSMLPKMEAITQFAAKGRGRIGIITSPEQLEKALKLESGTIVQGK